ncbi:MAG: CoA-transferase subunit beta [Candidatus Thorarchaeota archaeon]
MNNRYSLDELLSIAIAREIQDYENVVIGAGIPVTACVLAKGLHAKNAVLMTEAGLIDFEPLVPLIGIADPGAGKGFSYSTDLFSMFTTHTYRGFVDVCFLGVGQVDKFGNINSTVIGDYNNFKRRLPGSGGAADFFSYAKRTVLTMNRGQFVEKLDYFTSPGYLTGGDSRNKSGRFLKDSGPSTLISRKGIFKFNPITKEMFLVHNHPGITVEEIRKDIPWKLKVSPDLTETAPPSAEELEFSRKFNPVQSIGQIAARRLINRKRYQKLPKKGINFLEDLRKEFFS